MTDTETLNLPCIKCDSKKLFISFAERMQNYDIIVVIYCTDCKYEYEKSVNRGHSNPTIPAIREYKELLKEKQKEQEVIDKEQAKIREKNKRARAFDILVKLTKKETEIKKRIERIIKWGTSLKD